MDMVLSMQGMPPPQAVLNKRPLWFCLMSLLSCTIFLRMAAFDIMGALLCGLLLLLSVVMVRDGMRELPKFGMIFGVLCTITFFFYALPLLSSLIGGRAERRVTPVETVRSSHTHQVTYQMTIKTTPFFDPKAPLLYNIQSTGMLAMPLCMLLGAYLGITAHQELQRHVPSFLRHDGEGVFDGPPELGQGHALAGERQGGQRVGGHGPVYGAAAGMASAAGSQQEVEPGQKGAFQGRAHKLTD